MDHDFFAAIAVMVIFGAPVAAWIVTRVLQHNERMEMIRRGMVPPPGAMPRNMPPPNWQPGAMPPPNVPGRGSYPAYDDYYYAQRQMRKGITLAFIGLALFIGLGSIGPLSGIGFAGPWLLGGLIPMFVGIAQIVNAMLNGARIPGFSPGGYSQPHATFSPPPTAGTNAPPQPPPAGPYAWRPGSTPEIERPVPPPDQRT